MKTQLLFLLAFCGGFNRTLAQILADDAEGKSSIVQYSNSINFDLAKAALSVGFNNYRETKTVNTGESKTLWGFSASARNSDGIATLFSDGQVQPESRLQLYVGRRKRLAPQRIRRYSMWYVSGGINAASFRYYDPTVQGTLNNRFVKTPYRGGFIDLGINYDYKANWLFGSSLGYERANTFNDNLTSKDYVVRTVDTIGNQQLISEAKYTGYTGDFQLYDRANVRTDVLYFKKITDTDFQVAWNILYTRSFISFDPNVAKGRVDVGSGLNFYNIKKGSFLGGLYVQTTDLFNSQNADTNAFGRLSFGIVAKYAFQSIANLSKTAN